MAPMTECSYGGCERPVEATVRWTDNGDEMGYCAAHVESAKNEFGDVIEVLD